MNDANSSEKESGIFRLPDLHEDLGVRKRNISALVQDLREGNLRGLDLETDPKVKRNASAAIVIEHVYANAQEYIDAHADDAGIDLRLARGIGNMHLKGATRVLRGEMHSILETSFVLRRMESERRRETTPKQKWLTVDHLYDRLQRSFVQGTKCMDPVRMEEGLENATQMLWASVREIPAVHANQSETPLTPERFQELCKSTIDLIISLSRTHMTHFSLAMQLHKDIISRDDHFPLPGYLSIAHENGHPTIGFSIDRRDATESWSRQNHLSVGETVRATYRDAPVTGCPALYAKAPNGKNVVTAMHEWTMRICERWLFPHLQEILARHSPTPQEEEEKRMKERLE